MHKLKERFIEGPKGGTYVHVPEVKPGALRVIAIIVTIAVGLLTISGWIKNSTAKTTTSDVKQVQIIKDVADHEVRLRIHKEDIGVLKIQSVKTETNQETIMKNQDKILEKIEELHK